MLDPKKFGTLIVERLERWGFVVYKVHPFSTRFQGRPTTHIEEIDFIGYDDINYSQRHELMNYVNEHKRYKRPIAILFTVAALEVME